MNFRVGSRARVATLLAGLCASMIPSARGQTPPRTRSRMSPASPPASRPSSSVDLTPSTVPSGFFGSQRADPIERPAYYNVPHSIDKSLSSIAAMMVDVSADGSMVGETSDIIASVPAESRNGTLSSAQFLSQQAEIGDEMKKSFDEAMVAVKRRYPKWEPGRIEFSFSERYKPHDGSSAGTAFAVLMLSMLEGFDIDTRCAITGDISVDWRVRHIAGVVPKLRGAAGEQYAIAGIPSGNASQIPDLMLLYGDQTVRDLQIFSLKTLQDAVALMRTDRSPQLSEAMELFAQLQPRMKAGRVGLNSLEIEEGLNKVLKLAPNHESARWLLELAHGTAPRQLTEGAALYNMMVAMYPYREILLNEGPVSRHIIPPATTANARKALLQMRPITPKDLQPLLVDCTSIVETAELIANRQSPAIAISARRDAWYGHYKALARDRDLMEKIVRQGF